MESKTPEELAALYAYHHTRFGDNPDWLAATWMNGHCEGYARGYAAALPKWVSVDQDNKPMEVIIDGTTYRLVK